MSPHLTEASPVMRITRRGRLGCSTDMDESVRVGYEFKASSQLQPGSKFIFQWLSPLTRESHSTIYYIEQVTKFKRGCYDSVSFAVRKLRGAEI